MYVILTSYVSPRLKSVVLETCVPQSDDVRDCQTCIRTGGSVFSNVTLGQRDMTHPSVTRIMFLQLSAPENESLSSMAMVNESS